jgi:hypothetical protein
MKEYLSQCARIAVAILIALCFTSCGPGMYDVLEASLDLGNQRYSGNSYESPDGARLDIGVNLAYMIIFAPPTNDMTLLPPAYEYSKYQLAYATTSQTFQVFGREEYHYRPTLSHRASADKVLDHLSVMSGLEFIQKNSKYEGTKTKLNYLQVPVLAIYTYDLGDDRKVFGGLGPYFAYGLGGKIKGGGFSEKAFDKDLGFKRFDAGLTLTAGYKINKKWSVRIAYDLGLANIQHESFDKTKNRSFSVNIGYWPQFIEKLLGK